MFLDRSWPIRGGAADIYMPLTLLNPGVFLYIETAVNRMRF